MRKRTILAVLLAFIASVGITAMWSAEGNDGEEVSEVSVVSETDDTSVEPEKKKKGNRFARAFKSPFKAFKKFFGKDNDKAARLTEKDLKNFETTATMRIDDATTQTEVLGVGGSATDHLRHGRALLQTGRTNEAISQLSKSLSLDPQLSEAANLLGVAFDRKGMRERAKEYYEKALKISPDDAQILNNLGYSLYLNGNYRSAVDKLKKANRLNPNDKRVLNNLALAQCRIGKYDDAYKNFAKAGGEFTGRLNIASILERQGRDEQAIAHYEAARRLQPTSATVLGQLTALYKRTGMKDPADSVKTEAVEETEESLASVEE